MKNLIFVVFTVAILATLTLNPSTILAQLSGGAINMETGQHDLILADGDTFQAWGPTVLVTDPDTLRIKDTDVESFICWEWNYLTDTDVISHAYFLPYQPDRSPYTIVGPNHITTHSVQTLSIGFDGIKLEGKGFVLLLGYYPDNFKMEAQSISIEIDAGSKKLDNLEVSAKGQNCFAGITRSDFNFKKAARAEAELHYNYEITFITENPDSDNVKLPLLLWIDTNSDTVVKVTASAK